MTHVFSAPAKINLSLRILGRREDGFHALETIMAPISLADRIEISLTNSAETTFSCSDPTVPADGSNLVLKAVEALREKAGRLPGMAIHLQKNIPHGAGLGGGSSDAAAVLRGLNEMLQLGFSLGELSSAASVLGSDVPFFLHRRVCECSGRGEVVRPLAGFALNLRLMLAKPPFGVPTPWAYQHWKDSKEIPGVDYSPQDLGGGVVLVNDLERPVFEKHFGLAQLKSWLRQQPNVRGALMSGSGATVFAVLEEAADFQRLAEETKAEFGEECWCCEARTVTAP